MITALLLAVTAPTAVDAERAFNADAQTHGQWTAFRKYAADNAVMFTPQPVNAQEYLKDRKDPPKGLRWSPDVSFVSCDGGTAVNHGPWRNSARKTYGTFTTVWARQTDGRWKWIYDGGDTVKGKLQPRKTPRVYKAVCGSVPTSLPFLEPQTSGASADGTLQWGYSVMADGGRSFSTFLWNGTHFEQLFYEDIHGE